MVNGLYSPAKGARKGIGSFIGALIPVVVGAVAVALSNPEVAEHLEDAWPAIPAAVAVAVANWFSNWVKNR